METLFQICKLLSIAAFLFYGVFCLCSAAMVAEFERFGLARMRVLIGTLEILGAVGILVGFVYAPLVGASAAGLSLLMLSGIVVRIRVQDPLPEMLPAFALLLVNAFLVFYAVRVQLDGSTQ